MNRHDPPWNFRMGSGVNEPVSLAFHSDPTENGMLYISVTLRKDTPSYVRVNVHI